MSGKTRRTQRRKTKSDGPKNAGQITIGRTTMYALIRAGDIATVRVGRLRRIPADALTAYTAVLLAAQRNEQPAA